MFLHNAISRYHEWRDRRRAAKAGDGLDIASQLPKLSDEERRQRLRQMLRDDVTRYRLQRGQKPKW